jgi:hypothetical protein
MLLQMAVHTDVNYGKLVHEAHTFWMLHQGWAARNFPAGFPDGFKALIQRMLHVNGASRARSGVAYAGPAIVISAASYRPTAAQVLEDPWIKGGPVCTAAELEVRRIVRWWYGAVK